MSPESSSPPESGFTKVDLYKENGQLKPVEPLTAADAAPASGPEDDIDLAHDMALVSDENRTKAAKNRTHAKWEPDSRAAFKEASDIENQPASGMFGERKKRQAVAEARARATKIVEDSSVTGNALAAIAEADGLASAGPTERAEIYDARAARLEEWVKILRDHPVSEEFRRAHPDFEVTPQNLVTLEEQAKKEESTAQKFEERAGDFEQTTRVSRDYLLSHADAESTEKYAELQRQIEEAQRAQQALIDELYRKQTITPRRDRAAAARNLLDELRGA